MNGFVESLCDVCLRIIIDTALRVYICYFLVEPSLAGTNLSDPFQQFFKIVLAEAFTLLEAFIVENKSLDDKFPERFCGPDAELRSLIGIYPVSDSNDRIKVVELGFVILAITGSYSKNSNN